jgi:hypothetical protein
LDSSIPATSLNVTFVSAPSIRRARERPNAPSAFICPPAARREIHTNSATSRITGPKPRIRLSRKPRPWLIGFASIVTLWSCSRLDSASVLANVGICVSKFGTASAFLSVGGYLKGFLNSPLTASPSVEIFVTLFAWTCSRNVGLYGIVTDFSRPGAKIATLR